MPAFNKCAANLRSMSTPVAADTHTATATAAIVNATSSSSAPAVMPPSVSVSGCEAADVITACDEKGAADHSCLDAASPAPAPAPDPAPDPSPSTEACINRRRKSRITKCSAGNMNSASASGIGTGAATEACTATTAAAAAAANVNNRGQRTFTEEDDMQLIQFWQDNVELYIRSSKLAFARRAAVYLNNQFGVSEHHPHATNSKQVHNKILYLSKKHRSILEKYPCVIHGATLSSQPAVANLAHVFVKDPYVKQCIAKSFPYFERIHSFLGSHIHIVPPSAPAAAAAAAAPSSTPPDMDYSRPDAVPTPVSTAVIPVPLTSSLQQSQQQQQRNAELAAAAATTTTTTTPEKSERLSATAVASSAVPIAPKPHLIFPIDAAECTIPETSLRALNRPCEEEAPAAKRRRTPMLSAHTSADEDAVAPACEQVVTIAQENEGADLREVQSAGIELRAQEVGVRKEELEMRKQEMEVREREIELKREELDVRKQELEIRRQDMELRQRNSHVEQYREAAVAYHSMTMYEEAKRFMNLMEEAMGNNAEQT